MAKPGDERIQATDRSHSTIKPLLSVAKTREVLVSPALAKAACMAAATADAAGWVATQSTVEPLPLNQPV
jgi:hypothetical protein